MQNGTSPHGRVKRSEQKVNDNGVDASALASQRATITLTRAGAVKGVSVDQPYTEVPERRLRKFLRVLDWDWGAECNRRARKSG